MANFEHKIWIWKVNQEVDVESAIAKGYIAIGENHKDIGDFSQFKHRDEFLDAIYAHYGSRQYVRAAQSYINMMYEASLGDIVVICKIVSKNHYLYGWGIISSDCEYLKNENSPISIQVNWHKPIMENPIVADRLSDNEVFTVTDDAQAAQVVSLLKIDESGIMGKMYLQDYIDLLMANHNIILNGAPGTGKTHLAKEIAEEMGAKVMMVQFHPSYDYTDFVEGLRPVKDKNGNVGFERKDGVFKEYCKDALSISGFTDAQIDKAIELFRRDMDGKLIPSYKRPQNQFGVRIIGNDIRIIPMGKLAEYNGESTDLSSVKLEEVVDFIKTGVAYHSYEPSVGNYIKTHYLQEGDSNVFSCISTPFIFIIDEINRGEISKIFGELFFSIDPGYRGEKGKVQTQYQNIVEDGDVFKDGFFVPENVYIIGTMNDIDRSVESMDFAMRRRFAWHEVTAEESAKNMGLNEEQTKRMKRLNQVISDTEGLGSAYHVGGSFFLKVQKGEMTVEALWNLNLKSLMKEYLRGLPDADETIENMENAYFLKEQKTVSDIDE